MVFSLLLIAAFPILGIKFTPIPIIIGLITSILLIIKNKKSTFSKTQLTWFFTCSSIYLIYIISCFFHPFNNEVSFALEKKISLLVFPLILILNPNDISKKQFHHVLLGFSLCTLLITLTTNIAILITGLPEKYILYNDFSFSYRNYFEDISRIHPTYISIFLGFSAILFLNFSLKKDRFKSLYFIAALICFISLIPLAAKMPILAFIIALTTYLYKQPQIWKKSKYFFFTLVIGLCIAGATIPALKIRINETINSELMLPQENEFNSVNVRAGIFGCSIELIKKHFIFGLGPGQIQAQLNSCYSNYNTTAFNNHTYNTHNEYFNIILGTGILGLVSFIVLLSLLIKHSYQLNNPLFLAFLLIVVLCFTTENILDRQAGVVFFSFFSALFTRYYIVQKQSEFLGTKIHH